MSTKIYAYNQDLWNRAAEEQFLITEEPAEITEIDNGVLLPMKLIRGTTEIYGDGLFEGGVCDSDGNFIAGQFTSHIKEEYNRSCIRGYDFSDEELDKRDETVIFGGVLVRHWGHMLCDSTSRLWYPVSHPELPYKIVFIRFPKQEFPYETLLSLAGIDDSKYEIIDKPTQFSKIIVPDETSFSGSGGFRKEWLLFFDAVRDRVKPSKHKRIYLTRTAFEIDNIIGEQYFEDYYVSKGYKVFSPEKLSIEEQVSIIAGADEIATTMGTISHLVLFAHPGIKMTVLNRSRDVVKIQIAINKVRGVNGIFVDAYRNFLPEQQGGNCIVFMAPNKNWRKYIQEEFSEPSDPEKDQRYFESKLAEYISRWGSFFATNPKHYHWIRNYNTKKLVEDINRAFFEKEIDTSQYEEAQALVNAKKEALEYRIQANNYVEANSISDADGFIFASGTVQIPFSAPEELLFGAYLQLEEERIDGEIDTCFDEEGQEYSWDARFDVQKLQSAYEKHPEYESAAAKFMIEAKNQYSGKCMTVIYRGKKNETLKSGLGRNFLVDQKLISLELYNDYILSIGLYPPEHILEKTIEYYIDAIEQREEDYIIKGYIRAALTCFDTIEYQLSIVRHTDEDSEAEETKELFFPVTVSRAEQDDDLKARFECVINKRDLITGLDCKADEGSRWDLYLSIKAGTNTRNVRIGKERSEDSYEQFRSGCLATSNKYIYGTKTGMDNLSFVYCSVIKMMKRVRIEAFRWNEENLEMEGWVDLERPLVLDKNICFGLYDRESETLVPLDKMVYSATDEQDVYNWNTSISYEKLRKEILNSLTSDRTYMDLCVYYEGEIKLIGKSRKPGTWDKVKEVPQLLNGYNDEAYKLPESDDLGFIIDAVKQPEHQEKKHKKQIFDFMNK